MTTDDRDPLADDYEAIYRFLRKSGSSPEDAEDIAQDVFEDAIAAAPVGADGRPPIAWLYTVARRRAIDHLRRTRRRRAIDQQLPPATQTDDTYGSLVRGALNKAIANLPADQREVVVARLLRGLSFKEIARKLGTTEAACKMRFVRALATVRQTLQDGGFDP